MRSALKKEQFYLFQGWEELIDVHFSKQSRTGAYFTKIEFTSTETSCYSTPNIISSESISFVDGVIGGLKISFKSKKAPQNVLVKTNS